MIVVHNNDEWHMIINTRKGTTYITEQSSGAGPHHQNQWNASEEWHMLVQIHVYRPYLAAKALTDILSTARGEGFIKLWRTSALSSPLSIFCIEYRIFRFIIDITWFKYMFIVHISLRKHRYISILLREEKNSLSYGELSTALFLVKW